jgi:hypothetical protein
MKKLMAIFTATVALGVLPSASQAQVQILGCSATGEIPHVFVPAGGNAQIDVRTSTPGSVTTRFNTADPKLINAALNAQSSHERVTVVRAGFPVGCGLAVNGLSAGGTASSITVAP